MSYRSKEAAETIAQMAVESFAEHVVKPDEQRSKYDYRWDFFCGAPGTWAHSFRVILRPGYVIVFGDIGDWILQHSDRDSIAWLRGAVRSPDYLLSKVRAGEVKQFYSGDARDRLNRELKEDPEHPWASGVQDELEFCEEDFSEHEWNAAWHEVGADEWPDCREASNGGLWLIEALRWFVANVDEALEKYGQGVPAAAGGAVAGAAAPDATGEGR